MFLRKIFQLHIYTNNNNNKNNCENKTSILHTATYTSTHQHARILTRPHTNLRTNKWNESNEKNNISN